MTSANKRTVVRKGEDSPGLLHDHHRRSTITAVLEAYSCCTNSFKDAVAERQNSFRTARVGRLARTNEVGRKAEVLESQGIDGVDQLSVDNVNCIGHSTISPLHH